MQIPAWVEEAGSLLEMECMPQLAFQELAEPSMLQVSIETSEAWWSGGAAEASRLDQMYLALDTKRCAQQTVGLEVVAVRLEAWACDQGWDDEGTICVSFTGADARLFRRKPTGQLEMATTCPFFVNLTGNNGGQQGHYQHHTAVLGTGHPLIREMVSPECVISIWPYHQFQGQRCCVRKASIAIMYAKPGSVYWSM